MILDLLAGHGPLISEIVADGSLVVTIASAICAMTKTPDPNTTWGKVYRGIEAVALLNQQAKEAGILPAASPRLQAIGDDVASVAREIIEPVQVPTQTL